MFIDIYQQLESKSKDRNEDDIFNETADQLISRGILQTTRFPSSSRESRQQRNREESPPPQSSSTFDVDQVFNK